MIMHGHNCIDRGRLGMARAFTLIEILITVVLVGLLAGLAIPAFNKAREKTYGFLMNNDARQLAGAAQQYVTEFNNVVIVPVSVNSVNGLVSMPLAQYVKRITKGSAVGDYNSAARTDETAFTMSNYYVDFGDVKSFDVIGKRSD